MLVVRYKESPANYRTHLAVFFFFIITFYVPAQLGNIFYPQRLSPQAVVTRVFPSSPRYVPSLLSRIR